jgi:hypothetical protein
MRTELKWLRVECCRQLLLSAVLNRWFISDMRFRSLRPNSVAGTHCDYWLIEPQSHSRLSGEEMEVYRMAITGSEN